MTDKPCRCITSRMFPHRESKCSLKKTAELESRATSSFRNMVQQATHVASPQAPAPISSNKSHASPNCKQDEVPLSVKPATANSPLPLKESRPEEPREPLPRTFNERSGESASNPQSQNNDDLERAILLSLSDQNSSAATEVPADLLDFTCFDQAIATPDSREVPVPMKAEITIESSRASEYLDLPEPVETEIHTGADGISVEPTLLVQHLNHTNSDGPYLSMSEIVTEDSIARNVVTQEPGPSFASANADLWASDLDCAQEVRSEPEPGVVAPDSSIDLLDFCLPCPPEEEDLLSFPAVAESHPGGGNLPKDMLVQEEDNGNRFEEIGSTRNMNPTCGRERGDSTTTDHANIDFSVLTMDTSEVTSVRNDNLASAATEDVLDEQPQAAVSFESSSSSFSSTSSASISAPAPSPARPVILSTTVPVVQMTTETLLAESSQQSVSPAVAPDAAASSAASGDRSVNRKPSSMPSSASVAASANQTTPPIAQQPVLVPVPTPVPVPAPVAPPVKAVDPLCTCFTSRVSPHRVSKCALNKLKQTASNMTTSSASSNSGLVGKKKEEQGKEKDVANTAVAPTKAVVSQHQPGTDSTQRQPSVAEETSAMLPAGTSHNNTSATVVKKEHVTWESFPDQLSANSISAADLESPLSVSSPEETFTSFSSASRVHAQQLDKAAAATAEEEKRLNVKCNCPASFAFPHRVKMCTFRIQQRKPSSAPPIELLHAASTDDAEHRLIDSMDANTDGGSVSPLPESGIEVAESVEVPGNRRCTCPSSLAFPHRVKKCALRQSQRQLSAATSGLGLTTPRKRIAIEDPESEQKAALRAWTAQVRAEKKKFYASRPLPEVLKVFMKMALTTLLSLLFWLAVIVIAFGVLNAFLKTLVSLPARLLMR